MKIVVKDVFCLVSVVALICYNIVVFANQPTTEFNGPYGGLLFIALSPIILSYIVVIALSTYLTLRTIWNLIVKGETKIEFIISSILVIGSLFLVGYGTFYKESDSLKEWRQKAIEDREKWNDSLLMKFGGGYEIIRRGCIWRGDTIIYKTGDLQIDTLVVDEASNTCHWTYKPTVNYKIHFFNKDKYTQDSANASMHPLKYEERMQYVINQVNNKRRDEFNFYLMGGADNSVKNDTIMCFLFQTSKHDSTRRMGYLYFAMEHGMAVLKDSCSDIYRLIDYLKEKDYRVSMWWPSYPSEYDLPLLRSYYRKEKLINDDFIQYTDYFDVLQKKPVITNFQTWVEYWNTTTESLVYIETKIESQQKANDYPIFDYRTEFSASKHSLDPADTLEVGRLVMRNGKYVKEVQMQKE